VGARGDGAGVDRRRLVHAQALMPVLVELALQFLLLSLLSFGGANATLPDIHRRVVDVHHWLTNTEFTQMFALSQAAPGPNVLVVSLIGWKVAGVVGGVIAMASMCAPSSLLTYWVAHASDRFRDAPLRIAIQRGLVPVTVGMIVASGYVLMQTTDHSLVAYALTMITALVVTTTRVHPLWLLAVGGTIGAAGWV
jgi:chromate transporter